MTDGLEHPSDPPNDPPSRRDPRLRPTATIVAVGVGLGLLVAVSIGVAGGAGDAAAVVLLLILAGTFGISSLFALGTALVDDWRGRPVGRPRIVVGVVLFVASAAFLVMTVGAGG